MISKRSRSVTPSKISFKKLINRLNKKININMAAPNEDNNENFVDKDKVKKEL